MKEIPLTQGKVALVDDADYEILSRHKWCLHTSGYAYRALKVGPCRWGKVFMHRAIMQPPQGLVIDHANGDKLDNRRRNLRICNQSDNTHNTPKKSRNTSGYKGVHHEKQTGLYKAYLTLGGKQLNLGRYRTAEEAARAYNVAAQAHHGEFARLNTI